MVLMERWADGTVFHSSSYSILSSYELDYLLIHLKYCNTALVGVAQWTEHQLVN